jgi:hypothetical protein
MRMPGQHKFQVGERVKFAPGRRMVGSQSEGVFEVIRIMPNPADGERSYRIKGGSDGHEHAVTESQIVSAEK